MARPTKDQIKALPLFNGLERCDIKLVENEHDAKQAIKALQHETCIGFDTESKPTFKKGEQSAGPTLIQLSTMSQAFLFPTQFPAAINAAGIILSNPEIKKVGFGLKNDKSELLKFGIKVKNTEDLATTLKVFFKEKQRIGARAAVAMLLNTRLSKSAQQSNWAAYPLEAHQIKYAANDAYAALCCEHAFLNINIIN